jgi:hypothetical protein
MRSRGEGMIVFIGSRSAWKTGIPVSFSLHSRLIYMMSIL